MKLNQALKQKSRLAGELVRLQAILQRENSRKSDSVSTVNRQEIWNKILETSNKLGELKGNLSNSRTNVGTQIENCIH